MNVIERHVTTITRVDFDRTVEEHRAAYDEIDYVGWFCLRTRPFPCPAEGCGFIAEFSTAAHLIVVWPEKDDLTLLRQAQRCQRMGRDPHVVEWEPSFGPPLSYYLWRKLGGPVHGKLERPEGW